MEDINQILADVKVEGTDPFAHLEKDTPSESPTEKEPETTKPEVTEPKEEVTDENVPFHKHPRWIERENELRLLREQETENQRVIAELSTFKDEAAKKFSDLDQSDAKVPEWFVELYGDNKVAWSKYAEHERAKEIEIENRILQKPEFQNMKQAADADRWNKWVESELGKLKAEGAEFDRNELIATMLEYRPTDNNNNFDFKKGYDLYKKLNTVTPDPAKSEARKQLADTTTRSSNSVKSVKDYMTPAQLRHTSWNSL